MQADKSLTLARLNYQSGQVRLSGQHEEMLILRKGGKLERVDTIDLGFPIGLDKNIADFIAEVNVFLEPGDGVVLFTDGFTEAENIDGELYGIERLCDVISRYWNQSAEEIKQAVNLDVHEFIGKQKIFDDLTLVILKQK